MAEVMRNAWRRLTRDTRGAEIAETAVVLPLLFVVVIAIFWFGQAFFIYGTVTHAARQGARAAVAPACATCASANTSTQNAINAVNNALIAAKLNPAQVQAPSPVPILCGCGTASSSCSTPTVACDGSVPSSNVCVQPDVQLSYPSVLTGAGTCGTSVSFRYKYPFHFTLPCWPQPCTSLDLQKTALPARAQMRAETQ